MLKNTKKWFKKRTGAKKLDLQMSREAFKEDFHVYYPCPSVDLKKYTNEKGQINLDEIPEENLIGFQCRYLTPDEFDGICSPDPKVNFTELVDIKKFHKLSKEEMNKQAEILNEKLAEAIIDAMSQEKSDLDIAYETAFLSCVDPLFESIDQLKQILPLAIINIIAEEAIKFTDGQNLMIRES